MASSHLAILTLVFLVGIMAFAIIGYIQHRSITPTDSLPMFATVEPALYYQPTNDTMKRAGENYECSCVRVYHMRPRLGSVCRSLSTSPEPPSISVIVST
ncbi:Protein of unknown function [Pyronema omphalodes CBS 100304]|uniref:Uncharacterized protein n=1 Tax=Pyronema omphalodes (strain CBS 100304) TaxID=1076935 RepID=U4L4N7_PYROM|nr:Protein of unknown function [Pyronema omphalodes CBS 100304]